MFATVYTLYQAYIRYKRDTYAKMFIEYTKRFENIMQSFPDDNWTLRLNLNSTTESEISPKMRLSILQYLNLCSEEYHLWKKGYLAQDVWEIWEKELIRTLQSPLFQKEWKLIATEFEAYEEFCNYVNDVQQREK